MCRVVLPVFLLTLMTLSVGAQPDARRELRGYAKIEFGMTEQQVRTVWKSSTTAKEGGGIRVTADGPINVEHTNYLLSARLERGRVVSVLLSSSGRDPSTACASRWQGVVSSVQQRYGAPDSPVKLNDYARGNLESQFTFRDGNNITIFSAHVPTPYCIVNVSYRRKRAAGPL
jgi:hypothetical protein